MKKILLIGCLALTGLFAENIKGVNLETYGVIIEPNSQVEKELKEVLNKHKLLKPEITILEPIIVEAKKEIDLNSCMSCHGKEFEKKALGKSKIVKEMSKKEIIEAMNGYKNDTYGGTLKAAMKPHAIKHNSEEIDMIAEQIKNL
jgi:cytochrome c553